MGGFKAANPYVAGGQAQTVENQQLADTADAQARAAGQTVQSAAVRTGQNAGGAIAATEQMQQENERALAGQEASATDKRLAADTGYQGAVLGATGETENLQDQLAQQQAGAAQGALGTQETAAQTPSFLDELGSGLIKAGDSFAQGAGAAVGKCWIAAAVFDEDLATGTKTAVVRGWLWSEWAKHWYAKPILSVYQLIGKWASQQRWIVRLLTPLFHKAFAKAVEHYER